MNRGKSYGVYLLAAILIMTLFCTSCGERSVMADSTEESEVIESEMIENESDETETESKMAESETAETQNPKPQSISTETEAEVFEVEYVLEPLEGEYYIDVDELIREGDHYLITGRQQHASSMPAPYILLGSRRQQWTPEL